MSENIQYYPLTHPQKGIWYKDKLYPGTSIGNLSGTLKIREDIDFILLEKAINIFIEKNDALRLKFKEINNEPMQYVSAYEYQKIDFFDFSSLGIQMLYEWDNEQTLKPFNLCDTELYYFAILKINDKESGLYINMHHLISDAWSVVNSGNEIIEYYFMLKNEVYDNNMTKASFIEVIQGEEEYLNSNKFEKDKLFWEEKFLNLDDISTLKTVNFNKMTTKAKRKTFVLPKKLCCKMQEFCKQNNTSIFSLYLLGLSIYLNRITNKNKVVIGVPVLNRHNARERSMMGMFTNTVPMMLDVNDTENVMDMVNFLSKEWASVLKHHKYPIQFIYKDLRNRHKKTDDLFDIMLSYQNAKILKDRNSGQYEGRWHFPGYQIQSLFIHLNDREDDTIIIDYDYLTDIFYTKEIEYLHDHIIRLMWHALDNPNNKLCKIEMLSEKEKQKILYSFNNTKSEFPIDKTIYQLYEEQVSKKPALVAVEQCDNSYTYEFLNKKANQLAHFLIDKGIQRGAIVPILVDRSFEALVAILAVMKAGAAYLPIDSATPLERIKLVLNDSESTCLITQSKLRNRIPDADKYLLIKLGHESNLDGYSDENPNIDNAPDDIAYIIYTSGSTGKPKGAMITHKNLTNYIVWAQKNYVKGESDVFPLFTSLSFDLTVTSLFTPLVSGSKIIIYEESDVTKVFRENRATVVKLTPSHLRLINSVDNSNSNIKRLVVGGEDLRTDLARKVSESFRNNVEIYNEYGPTETTVGCMIYKYNYDKDKRTSVPIGVPASNVKLYILDKYLNPVAINMQGELCIGGEGVGKGYLNKPELTKEKFIRNPFNPNEIIYRSGDLARWFSGGDVEYIGRIDRQVKIRGYRIELGEIENCISSYPGIKDAIVIDLEDAEGKKSLCAYYITESGIDIDKIKSSLVKQLPIYMIPSFFVKVDNIPLTQNGKVDVKSLPHPVAQNYQAEYVAPSNSVQAILAKILAKILKIERISIIDNFFELGADSLTIVQIQTSTLQYGWGLKTQDFYNNPTVLSLADNIINKISNNIDDVKPLIYNSLSQAKLEISEKSDTGDILITGVTGFFGSHILHEVLTNSERKIYCLIRGENAKISEQKLQKTLNYYFGVQFDRFIGNRIFVICGDITLEKFGLNEDEYLSLGKTVKTLIHCAALVKHYGNFEEFERTNVYGTISVVNFAKQFGIFLEYISTTSVSGNYLVKQQNELMKFTENDFYISQRYNDNVYIKGKFIAEESIFEAMNKGLKARVYRIGVLTGRYNDGYFQKNIENNSFYNKIKSIIEIGVIPENIIEIDVEFTPVDLCSKALFALINSRGIEQKVFHLINPNYIKMSEIINILCSLNYRIDIVSVSDFAEQVRSIAESVTLKEKLRGIINDFGFNWELKYDTKVIIKSDVTQMSLLKLGFTWPEIDRNYIAKVIRHMQKQNFIKGGSSIESYL